MDSKKKKICCKMTTRPQFELLIKIMDENKILAKGYTSFPDKDEYKLKWIDIANQLNLIGPPERDIRGWEKVWYDLKNKVKLKINKNKKKGIDVTNNLSPIEDKVLHILDLCESNDESVTMGFTDFTKPELTIAYEEQETLMEEESNQSIGNMEEGLTNFDFIQLNNKSGSRDFSKTTFERNRSIDVQLDLIKQQLLSLEKIQKSIKAQSIKKDKTAKYIKKTYKIEKKKFALYQKSLKKKEEMRIKKENWKMELLQYKQEKLKIMKIQLKYKDKEIL